MLSIVSDALAGIFMDRSTFPAADSSSTILAEWVVLGPEALGARGPRVADTVGAAKGD
jgi:hypothetical protein